MQAAIRGMVESLDPHSTFLSSDQFEDMKVTHQRRVCRHRRGGRRRPGTASAWCGACPARQPSAPGSGPAMSSSGSTMSRSTRQTSMRAIERMRGPEGSPIRLAVRRVGTAALLRVRYPACAGASCVSVEAELLTPDYGYLRITSFTDSTASELEDAVDRLEHAPAAATPLKGFIIDLRNNPGGVLDAAVQIADDFLDQRHDRQRPGTHRGGQLPCERPTRGHHARREAGAAGQWRLGLGRRDPGGRPARQCIVRC